MALKDAIFQKGLNEKIIPVKDWDTDILIKGLNGTQSMKLAEFNAGKTDGPTLSDMYGYFIISNCFDPETREPVFSEEDLPRIMDLSGAAIEKLIQSILELSGLLPGAIESAEKN